MVPRRDAFKRDVRLLSAGFVNRKAFPGGHITVFPWDSRIDEWLAQQTRSSGAQNSLFELVTKVSDLNGCPLDDFLVADVNTVLLVSRALRYNSEVSYFSVCPACKRQDSETIRVPDELDKLNEKPIDYPGWDEVTLPDCGDVLKIRSLQIKDERAVIAREDDARVKVPDRIARIIRSIVSINDSLWDMADELVTYYDCLSPKDAAFIEEAIDAKEPRLNTSIWHQCKSCGTKFRHELVIDQQFFR
jgi:hypothetical protein